MANVKITALPAAASVTSDDILPMVDIGTTTTQKVTLSQILALGASPTGSAGGDLTGSTYPNPIVSSFGGKIHWLVEGGKYATLQAAFDAAVEGDTIVAGPKATGTWGDLVITENKTMSYVGLNGVNGKQVKIGAITFSPATGGLNINRNEHFFANLMVSGSFASQAVLFSGTGAGRMRFAGCFINNTSTTGDGVVNSNTFNTGTTSSLWLDDTVVLVSTTSGAAIRQSGQYTFVKNRCDISGGASAVVLTAGTFESVGASIEMNGTGSVISVAATLPTVASCLLGYSTVRNTTTNGSGVTLTGNGAALSAGDAAFVVATAAASTIAVSSNGQALPQATINVVTAAAFTPTGSLIVVTSTGSQIVTYTGKTATSFTGCSGGTGTMTTGGAVTQQGVGYCVKGTGTFLYAQNTFSNSAAVAYNVRVQNTVTALPVATTFTSAL